MKLGIIGLSGAGKSTMFEALTHIQPDAGTEHKLENRIGTIRVPDKRIDFLSGMFQPNKTIYAQIEYLLPRLTAYKQDKSREESTWTDVRTCDALIHVVRNFRDYSQNQPEPVPDFHTMDQEMIIADLLVVEKRLERIGQDSKRGKKTDEEEKRLLCACQEMLEKEIPLRRNPELANAHQLKGYTFLSAKPMLVLFNNEDDDDNTPPDATELMEHEQCMVARGRLEHELYQMDPEEAADFLEEFNVSAPAMDRVIGASYKLLGLISFFTVGKDEVRAWTISASTPAVDAAEVIHSDIKKGFIRAEVLAYDDLLAAGSYKEARKKGTVRLEGKTYQVKDGDIIEFRFNV
jgi:GTP-binding protein YchF